MKAYEPSPEEIQKAEEMMTDAQREMSIGREWEELKEGGPALALNKGREIGVPQEELDRFSQDVISRETKEQSFAFVYRFRKNMGIGTAEELKSAAEQAYKSSLDSRDFGYAMSIAEDVYGRDSEEWGRANKENEAELIKIEERRKRKEKEIESGKRKLNVTLSKKATFSDLFGAIDSIEEKEGIDELHFEEELIDNFDPEIVEEILSFQDTQADKAIDTKVMDFFKERGYSQKDISTFLPLKFKRERKKKR